MPRTLRQADASLDHTDSGYRPFPRRARAAAIVVPAARVSPAPPRLQDALPLACADLDGCQFQRLWTSRLGATRLGRPPEPWEAGDTLGLGRPPEPWEAGAHSASDSSLLLPPSRDCPSSRRPGFKKLFDSIVNAVPEGPAVAGS
ncbi:hypothetical protein C7M84_003809 [Penaeus vannamei]|uniref:Uncharacterized protein n=1 Tax=Penaeus vannamei TaxID=6689 RepID=A0A3R7P7F9_PENVA|nr:hypothetical protein C7M84_003809 [Penaeus vannamei]